MLLSSRAVDIFSESDRAGTVCLHADYIVLPTGAANPFALALNFVSVEQSCSPFQVKLLGLIRPPPYPALCVGRPRPDHSIARI